MQDVAATRDHRSSFGIAGLAYRQLIEGLLMAYWILSQDNFPSAIEKGPFTSVQAQTDWSFH